MSAAETDPDVARATKTRSGMRMSRLRSVSRARTIDSCVPCSRNGSITENVTNRHMEAGNNVVDCDRVGIEENVRPAVPAMCGDRSCFGVRDPDNPHASGYVFGHLSVRVHARVILASDLDHQIRDRLQIAF